MCKFRYWILTMLLLLGYGTLSAQSTFRVIAFFTAKNDPAHISFVQESNTWFPAMGLQYGFTYDTTSNWDNMNSDFLSHYQVVLFLDTRPEKPAHRVAFESFMEKGGGFIGFHFSAFALQASSYEQNWDWYHHSFLGAGEYKSNTWRPTPAMLVRERLEHPVLKGIPDSFLSVPNEWYRWQNDLRQNRDIRILLAIGKSSFPLGTGPKAHEIWHEGYYPVVWTNKRYRMLYINMGHNDMDYGGTGKVLSSSFDSEAQNRLLINAILWAGGRG